MDVILVGFVAGLTWAGWRTGFVRRLAGIAFIAISFVAGAYLQGPFGDLVNQFFPDMPAAYAGLLAYAFLFPIVLVVLHVVSQPFLKGIKVGNMTRELDKALGALFGFVEGVLILSVIVVIFDTYFAISAVFSAAPGLSQVSGIVASFNESYTVHLLRATTVPIVLTILGPLLPKDISSLVPGGLPGMPGIPGVPGVPGVPGLPGLPTHTPVVPTHTPILPTHNP
jgi:uncharacterized membrane protein required for colicin V production